MTKTNKDSLIEVVCSEFNGMQMHTKDLEQSPELKTQIFLNKHSAEQYLAGRESKEDCTSIACGLRSDTGKCEYSMKACKYNDLYLKE